MQLHETLVERLRSVQRVAVLTGAGISAESGVPTFRGDEGIWKKFKPEELARFDAFMANPELVWEWYKMRKRVIESIQPNPGHFALAEMEKLFAEFSIATQNIDNLHRRAGSRTVFELHGNIERNYCLGCGKTYSNADIFSREGAPRCDRCRGLIRPDVVWFGEMLPEGEWDNADLAARSADVYMVIGTSAIVYPAASLPDIAKNAGAFLVEINPEETPLTQSADLFIKGKSGEILPALLEQFREGRKS